MIKRLWFITLSITVVLATFSCSGFNTTPKTDDENNAPDIPNLPETPGINTDDTLFTFDRLFDDGRYKEINLIISQTEWDQYRMLQQSNQNQYGTVKTESYAKANLHYVDEGGELLIKNIGIRIRGNTSQDVIGDVNGYPNLVHWKLNFRYQFDGKHPENSGRRGFELKELDMKYNKNDDPSYMTEAYAMEMFNHFDVYAAETSHARVSVTIGDAKYVYGVYTIFEPIDDEFVERRFVKKSNDGNLYKSLWQSFGPASLQTITNMAAIGEETITYHPSYDLKTNNEIANHNELKQFIENINQKTGTDFKNYITRYMNVDMFLTYLAVDIFLGNIDTYRGMGNNYYLYQDSLTKMWYMIPYDYDNSMGYGWNPTGNATIGLDIYAWQNQMAINSNDPTRKAILVEKVLDVLEFRNQYDAIIQNILNDSYFTFDSFYSRYKLVRDLYADTLDNALYRQTFSRGHSEWFIPQKRQDIHNQLNG